MYILTKRAISDVGKYYHHVHGMTPWVTVARAWFRSSRDGDVVEVLQLPSEIDQNPLRRPWATLNSPEIQVMRIKSWRERQDEDDKLLAHMRAKIERDARRP